MGAQEVDKFLTSLAVKNQVSASTQNQALAAILFLYRDVLEIKLPWLTDVVRAKRPQHLPVVLTRGEVKRVLERVSGLEWLVVSLLHGTGMRLGESVQLRVKDVDLAPPPLSAEPAARRQARREGGRYREARELPHVQALLRDPPAGGPLRHPHRAGRDSGE